MAEEQVDVGYISLQGYITNTPSDTEMHAEHQLREDRGKEYTEPRKTWQDEGTRRGNRSISRTGPAFGGQGN